MRRFAEFQEELMSDSGIEDLSTVLRRRSIHQRHDAVFAAERRGRSRESTLFLGGDDRDRYYTPPPTARIRYVLVEDDRAADSEEDEFYTPMTELPPTRFNAPPTGVMNTERRQPPLNETVVKERPAVSTSVPRASAGADGSGRHRS